MPRKVPVRLPYVVNGRQRGAGADSLERMGLLVALTLPGLVLALLGVDAKLRQYRDGERFVRGVVERAGMEGFNRVWARADNLPTKAELADPQAWVTRVVTPRELPA